MNITVTGAAGFLGSHVCKALVEAGHTVRATDKSFRKDLPVRLEVVNLLSREDCYRLVEGADVLVQLGNYPNASRASDAQTLLSENVTMNMNMFQAASETGVKKIIFSSSIQVISANAGRDTKLSPPPYFPMDENTPANPRNAYALSKQLSENMLHYFTQIAAMECVAIRFPLILREEWMRRFRKNPGENPADANEAFSYLHIADATSLVCACIETSLPGYRVYLPAARDNRLRLSAAEAIAKHYAAAPLRRPIEEIESLIDVSSITRDTGWTPQFELTPLEELEAVA